MNAEVALTCAACKTLNDVDARFCNQCGATLQPSLAAVERKQVSVLFSDLSGFTAASQRLDPEEMREIMARIFSNAAAIVARHQGRIEKFIGDAMMAIFGVPTAHEDDPVRAVRAAMELHDAVRALSPELEPRIGAPITMHSGIACGVVVTGELKFDHGVAGPLGSTVNLAARLMNAAPAGEIWITGETLRLLGTAVQVEDRGRVAFKGITEKISVTRVLALKDAPAGVSSPRSRFVGRDDELARLTASQVRACTGVATCIGVRGDAGSGKSRLLAEFRLRLDPKVRWLEGRAHPHATDTPYAPVIDLLSRSWGIDETDPPQRVRDRIVVALTELLGSKADSVLPLFLHLYRLNQDEGVVVEREAFQQRLTVAMRHLLAAVGARSPTVVCLQDLHWADTATLALLREVVNDLHTPLLLLVNYRTGVLPWPALDEVPLGELSAGQTGEIVTSLLGGEPPDAVRRFIFERSDGNPFYAEELVQTLLETGVVERTTEGVWAMVRSPETAGIPATVRGVIAARIDRLDAPHKAVLRDASIVGREFLRAIVAAVTHEPALLDRSLVQLQTADLVRQRRGEPDAEYWFKHALTHDVAYESMLMSDRQRLHGEVGRAIEQLLSERIAEFVEPLAYHFRLGGVTEKAIRYLIAAGRTCVERYALVEAGRHFRNGYTLLIERAVDPTRARLPAELLIEWSHVHYYEGTILEWSQLLERHQIDVDQCDDVALRAMYMGWLGNVRLFRADPRGSLQILDRALDLARGASVQGVLAYLLAWRVHATVSLGQYEEAINNAHEVMRIQRDGRAASYPWLKADAGLAHLLVYRGELGAARRICDHLIATGLASGNSRAASQGYGALHLYWMLALDFERAAASSSDGMRVAHDPTFLAMNGMWTTLALVTDMKFDEARVVCEQHLGFLLNGGNLWFGQPLRTARDAIGMVDGNYSDGMRAALSGIDQSRSQGWEESVFYSEVLLLLTYVSIARRDLPPKLGALLRNPWFLLTQAAFAGQHAKKLIQRLRAEADSRDSHGFDGLIDLAEARLLTHRGRHAQARDLLERMRTRLRGFGIDHEPATLARLAGEIAARRK